MQPSEDRHDGGRERLGIPQRRRAPLLVRAAQDKFRMLLKELKLRPAPTGCPRTKRNSDPRPCPTEDHAYGC